MLVPVAALGVQPGIPLLGGIALGYLSYDWIHFYEHHAKPRTRLGKLMRRLHSIHHYNDSEVNHGISSPLWDGLFRSYRDSQTSPRADSEQTAAK